MNLEKLVGSWTRPIAFSLATLFSTAGCGGDEPAGCNTDADCEGDRVCEYDSERGRGYCADSDSSSRPPFPEDRTERSYSAEDACRNIQSCDDPCSHYWQRNFDFCMIVLTGDTYTGPEVCDPNGAEYCGSACFNQRLADSYRKRGLTVDQCFLDCLATECQEVLEDYCGTRCFDVSDT